MRVGSLVWVKKELTHSPTFDRLSLMENKGMMTPDHIQTLDREIAKASDWMTAEEYNNFVEWLYEVEHEQAARKAIEEHYHGLTVLEYSNAPEWAL